MNKAASLTLDVVLALLFLPFLLTYLLVGRVELEPKHLTYAILGQFVYVILWGVSGICFAKLLL